jgi:hypothetical protein
MTNLLIGFLLVIFGIGTTVYLWRRGLKVLRDQKIVTNRGTFTGKDSVSIARIYFFFSAICLISTALFICALIAQIIHVVR